jgi:uncharacterized protein (TIGR02391 family)
MIEKYLEIRKVLSEISAKSFDALNLVRDQKEDAAKTIRDYIISDYRKLQGLWAGYMDEDVPGYLSRHIHFGTANDYDDIVRQDIPHIEARLDERLAKLSEVRGDLGFENLLHPEIKASSYQQFRDGHLREAVLNAIMAIFDLIRDRVGLDGDGTALVGEAFSLSDPYLIFSEVDTESGQNDQKGFIQILNGSYQGIRNPKAHSLAHDLTEEKAAQYLVFASLLARRVDEAKLVKFVAKGKLQPIPRRKP